MEGPDEDTAGSEKRAFYGPLFLMKVVPVSGLHRTVLRALDAWWLAATCTAGLPVCGFHPAAP